MKKRESRFVGNDGNHCTSSSAIRCSSMMISRSGRRPWKGGRYHPKEEDGVPSLDSNDDNTSDEEESDSDETSDNGHLRRDSI